MNEIKSIYRQMWVKHMEAYLDYSATTPVCQESIDAMTAQCLQFGNPSSLHRKGLEAELSLKSYRGDIAKRVHCLPKEIFFTSGGTESNNWAIFGGAQAGRRKGNRIVTTAVEHASVFETCKMLERQGFDVVFLKPKANGSVSPEAVKTAITSDTILVTMMACNNETGALQPISAAADAIREVGAPALLHCDGVQSFCKLPFDPKSIGVDLYSFSSHKIYGPKGVGGLMIRDGVRIEPRVFGGGQELGLRPGTENMIGIAGFAAAARVMPSEEELLPQIQALKKLLLERVGELDGVTVNGGQGSPYITNLSIPGVPAEVMLHFLEEQGVFVSTGSACKKGAKSHVLSAMGLPTQRIGGALRISLGRTTTAEEIIYCAEQLGRGLQVLHRRRGGR